MYRISEIAPQPRQFTIDMPKGRSILNVLTLSTSGGSGSEDGLMNDDKDDGTKCILQYDGEPSDGQNCVPIPSKRVRKLKKVIKRSFGGVKRAFRKFNCARSSDNIIPQDCGLSDENNHQGNFLPNHHQHQFAEGLASHLPSFTPHSHVIRDILSSSSSTKASFQELKDPKDLPLPSMIASFGSDCSSDAAMDIEPKMYRDDMPFTAASLDTPPQQLSFDNQSGKSWSYDSSHHPLMIQRPSCNPDNGEEQPNFSRGGSLMGPAAWEAPPVSFSSSSSSSSPTSRKSQIIGGNASMKKIRWELVKMRLALRNRNDTATIGDMDGLFQYNEEQRQEQMIDFAPLVPH